MPLLADDPDTHPPAGHPHDRHAKMLWIFCLVLLLQAKSSMSAKIIGGSAIGGSHYMMIRNVVEELASRGHEVRT